MSNTRASDRTTVRTTQSQVGWLLVLMIAAAGVMLAVLEVGLWLIFASGSLATFAVVGLFRAREAAPASVVRHAESGWAYLRTELARSRRHNREFALIGIPEDVWVPAAGEAADRADIGLAVAADVQRFLRRPDRAWVDGDRMYIVLTDCDRQSALAFIARARADMPQLFGDERVRLVVFPDDGITSGALLEGLDRDPQAESEPTRLTAAR